MSWINNVFELDPTKINALDGTTSATIKFNKIFCYFICNKIAFIEMDVYFGWWQRYNIELT